MQKVIDEKSFAFDQAERATKLESELQSMDFLAKSACSREKAALAQLSEEQQVVIGLAEKVFQKMGSGSVEIGAESARARGRAGVEETATG